MKQLSRSKAAAKLFSPAALALAVGLACWGSAALGTSNPIPGIDIIVRKKPGGSIVVTPTSDHSGKFSVKLGSGDYTVSTACKSGGCTPSQLKLDNLPGAKLKLEADGSTSYEFHVGKGGLELRGQTLSVDLPKDAGANDAPGKANLPIITKDVDNLAMKSQGKETDRAESTGVGDATPPPVIPVIYTSGISFNASSSPAPKKVIPRIYPVGTPLPSGGDGKPGISEESNSAMGQVSTTRGRVGKPPVDPAGPAANHRVPQYELPSNIPGVAAEVGKPPAGPAGISDQGATGGLISYSTAPRPTIGDDKPTNKYANDFAALKDQIVALKAQVTALQTAVASLPTTASITALSTSLTTDTTKIDAITTTLNTVASAGTATKAVVDGLKTDLTALKTDVTALATKVAADNPAMKTQSTPLKKEDQKNASVDNAVSGFGTGMVNSPSKGPDLNSMGGMNPGMIPAPPMPSMPTMPTMGPAGGPSAMSPGGPGSAMHH